MKQKNKIEPIVRSVSFAEAEMEELNFYVNNSWIESVRIVEEMRSSIWRKVYFNTRSKDVFISNLKSDRYEFE